MEHRFPSGGNLLAAHLARPPMRADVTKVPAVVLAHGYPSDVNAAAQWPPSALPELADRIARGDGLDGAGPRASGAAARPRAASRSGGWLDDLLAAVAHLDADRGRAAVSGWSGFGTGGALAICAAPRDRDDPRGGRARRAGRLRRLGLAPRRLLEHAREVGMIREPTFPAAFDAWSRELRDLRAVADAPEPGPASACWWCTAATTTSCPCSTPGCWSMPTAPPSCASSTAPGTACATTRGRSPCSSVGSTASATATGPSRRELAGRGLDADGVEPAHDAVGHVGEDEGEVAEPQRHAEEADVEEDVDAEVERHPDAEHPRAQLPGSTRGTGSSLEGERAPR